MRWTGLEVRTLRHLLFFMTSVEVQYHKTAEFLLQANALNIYKKMFIIQNTKRKKEMWQRRYQLLHLLILETESKSSTLYGFFFNANLHHESGLRHVILSCCKKVASSFQCLWPLKKPARTHSVIYSCTTNINSVLFLNTNWIKIMWRTSTVQLTGFIYGIILWFFFVCFRSPDLSLHLLSKIPLLSGYSLLQGPLSVRAGITN